MPYVFAMDLLLSVKSISKTMGSKQLFDSLSFGIFEGEKIGLIGPNGAGKSTLLKLLARQEIPDEGEVNHRKNLTVSFVNQDPKFGENQTALEILKKQVVESLAIDAIEAEVQASIYLGSAGFEDFDQKASRLSGGWKKRLAIARALIVEPDLLILDEPTNHMDWDGILWLEEQLRKFKKALLIVSHDRAFLNKSTNRTIEINRLYRDGYLSFNVEYQKFLEKKEEYVQAQLALQQSLSNKARREVEWLRAGVKARTTKSRARIEKAHDLLETLEDVKSRNLASKERTKIEIDSSGRKTKKLLEVRDLKIFYDDLTLVDHLEFTFSPRSCIGVLGKNGSGKTSLLKVLSQKSENYSGDLFWAEDLKVVYFDQKREDLPGGQTLMEFLGDGSDYVLFKDKSLHVAAYANRFLFSSDKMNLKISQLSGGEQARVLIAKLLLQPADVLILDEPTNDLDIETIEILEETISSFEGLVLLVSHDREFLKNLCQRYLALDGQGGWSFYTDLNHWLRDLSGGKKLESGQEESSKAKGAPKQKVKLSYKDKKALETIEEDILKAEDKLSQAQERLSSPEIASNHEKLQAASEDVGRYQDQVDQLYLLWEELEEKKRLSQASSKESN